MPISVDKASTGERADVSASSALSKPSPYRGVGAGPQATAGYSRRGSGAPDSLPGASPTAAESIRLQERPANRLSAEIQEKVELLQEKRETFFTSKRLNSWRRPKIKMFGKKLNYRPPIPK